jgi:acetyl esterase
MARIDDISVNAPGRSIPLRLYRPRIDGPLPDGPLPLVMYLHGGRFISGDFITHDPVCRQLAAAAECIVAAVDYRLAPEHPFPAAVEDAEAAAGWLQQHAPQLGGNGRWAIVGDSAGGNLAAAVALVLRDRAEALPHALGLIYPMLDATCSLPSHHTCGSGYGAGSEDMKAGYRLYLPEGTDPGNPSVSPLFAEDLTGLPATLVLTAEYDSLRDEAETFAQRLGQAGVPVRQKRYTGAIHGFFQMGGVIGLGRQAMQDVAGFLREALQAAD